MGKIYNYDTESFIGGPVKEVAKHHKTGTKYNESAKTKKDNKTGNPFLSSGKSSKTSKS